MNQEQQQIATNYLKAIFKEKNSVCFLEPVDYVGLNLTDYPIIIKHPMDLGTVKKKFEDNKYQSYEDFLKDIQLIWDNCKTYNMEGSPVYKMAQSCEKFTKKFLDKYNTQPPSANKTKSNKKQTKNETSKNVSEISQNNVNNQNGGNIVSIPNLDYVANENAEITPFNEDNKDEEKKNKDLDIEEENLPYNPNGLNSYERQVLSNRVKKLQNDGLASLVRLVEKYCPASIRETEDNIEIMLVHIDKNTYEQINRLIDTFLKVKETNQENLENKKSR